ncbi:MAG: ParE toxin of type II toxin-antitoxin system, parDE [Candidatus Kentron sp. G]|nr:MAG: ParE toxin of type II toxin-antitoxin system, parDE [Candidatus Kentron sp. G]VFM95728.1 MAG: ParE toxin of type II toxin-antitoxin system, parDE [Candidatus Kentron sp. G]VFM97505.1 MAG: ParE toxin of type II toxin-antitoxin system, parDE [Candidatus Kentron sp. G]
MKRQVVVRTRAEADMANAQDWYEKEQAGLGGAFRGEVHAAIERIRENPRIYPLVYRGIQRALLHRFPYALFYLENDRVITIIACIHARRNPAYIHRELQKSNRLYRKCSDRPF